MLSFKNTVLLGSTALAFLGLGAGPAFAQCVTTGAITADCDFSADTTGAITLGNVAAGVTATVTANVNIANTIDDDDATADGVIVTDGSGVTVTQTAAIGGGNAINTLSIGDADAWTTSADITTAGTLTVGGGTSGSFIIDGSSSSVTINAGASTGAIAIADGGTLQISSSNNAVSLGVNAGITIAGDGVLQIDDDTDTTLGVIEGASDGEGVLTINNGYDTDATIGATSALATINVAGGTFTVDQNVTANSTVFTAAGAQITISSGTFDSAVTGSSGIDSFILGAGGTVTQSINLGAGNDVLTLNGGTITSTLNGGAGNSDGITLGADFTTTNTITNFEQIDVSGNVLTVEHAVTNLAAATQDGVDVAAGTLNINAGGSLDGTVYDSVGGGVINFGADSSGATFNLGGFLEDVDVNLVSGILNTNGNSVGGSVAVGSVDIAASTRLNVNDNFTSDGDLTNAGTIFVDAGNTFTTNTQTASTGTFIIEVERDVVGESDDAGRLVVSGGDIDLTGSTLEILVSSDSGVLSDGAELLIGDGLTTVTGGPGGTAQSISSNSFLYDFSIVDGTGITTPTTDDDLYLLVDRKSLNSVSVTENNAIVAGIILDNLSTSLDANISDIQAKLVTTSTGSQFNEELEALLPTIDGAVREAGLITAQNTISLTTNRLAGLRQTRGHVSGMASGDATEGVKVWFQPFVQAVKQREREEINGYDALTVGQAFGFDNSSIFENMTLGLAFAYANTDADSDNQNRTDNEIDSFLFSFYGDYDIDERSYLNFQLGYTYNDVAMSRYNVGGVDNLDTNVDYGTDQYSLYLEAGRDVEWGKYTTLTPSVSAAYNLFTSDIYVEQGAQGAGLTVDTSDSSQLDLGIGLDASWIYRKKSGSYIRPEISAKISYDAMGEAVETKNYFNANQNETFITEGGNPAKVSYNLGIGTTYFGSDNWEISGGYDFTYKQDYYAHTGFMKFAYKF